MNASSDITQLLEAHAEGDVDALHVLLPVVYDELRQIAHGRLYGERLDHTLNTTALVHEAYLKLAGLDRMSWQNRAHFYAIASQCMRNVLVDYAVRRKAQKRGGGQHVQSLDDVEVGQEASVEDLLSINEALKRLEVIDERQTRIVECRFFGGMSIEETAHALDISPATVSRDWTFARAWLARELGEVQDAASGNGGKEEEP